MAEGTGPGPHADALARLAELRLRKGRLEDGAEPHIHGERQLRVVAALETLVVARLALGDRDGAAAAGGRIAGLAAGDPELAVAEARGARDAFERLGAGGDADAAGALLRALGAPGGPGPGGPRR
jgi:hypothetical protein